ncbi:unnamed protein product [Rhizoctonia solani]|uniref:DDE-1 domain-containing protein n=1 Tax=Rhizoctonia solani TaxID=456999 RepID=A0A8H2XMR1_9AGAM|nr:unnamed protein product [Rhizoctonia solani]
MLFHLGAFHRFLCTAAVSAGPMDAGIIKNFKGNYCKLLIKCALDLDMQGVADHYKVNQLQSMRMLTRVWEGVSESAIKNCWRHTGILPEDNYQEEPQDAFARARL